VAIKPLKPVCMNSTKKEKATDTTIAFEKLKRIYNSR
jgi:hypothetical protein